MPTTFAAAVLALSLPLLSASAACARANTQSAPQVVPVPPQGQPTLVQPGAPGEESKTVSPETSVRNAALPHTAADTRFMQGMIGHHAQALDMVRLLETRSENPDMKLLALRIKVSQRDEIKFMQDWLRERGETVPSEHAHHAHDFTLMPGMLSPDEMKTLEAAKGRAFDLLFLEYMIKHHQGALVMVDELFKQNGAGQEAMMQAFASDVVADQQMEITRMIAMWRGMQK